MTERPERKFYLARIGTKPPASSPSKIRVNRRYGTERTGDAFVGRPPVLSIGYDVSPQ
jgi:hypothetical protein